MVLLIIAAAKNISHSEGIELKDLGDDDIALGPHRYFEVKTWDRLRLKIINRLVSKIF